MIDPNSITKDMPVIASDGERIGEVDGVEGGGVEGGAGLDQDARIKLKRNTSPDGQHHYVAMSDVARIDEHVHLSRSAADVRAGWMTAVGATGAAGAAALATTPHATATATTHTDHGAHDIRVEDNDDKNWLPWILGALALLALLVFGLRSCDGQEPAQPAAPAENAIAAAPVDDVVVEEQSVALPGGGTVMLASGTIGYELQRYLASGEAAPRTFQFERLNFDTAKADVRAIDRPTVDGLGTILKAYPNSRVRVVGYADARGDAGANAGLGLNRAKAVAAALTGAGISAERIETATGGEENADATNATSAGQAENRRTELVVLAK